MFLMKHLFLLATIAVITEKLDFFLPPWQPLLGKQILSSQSRNLSVKTIHEKWSQTRKDYSKKMSERCILYLIAKNPDPSNGVKIKQKTVFWIATTICHYH